MAYIRYREQVWPYGRLWGDREERKAVRDYLKKVWKENITTWPVEEDTVETTRREKNSILNWWWRDRYGQSGTAETNDLFGQWLLSQYQDYAKLHHRTNRQIGRN